jgi:hypothetical protein
MTNTKYAKPIHKNFIILAPIQANPGLSPAEISLPSSLWITVNKDMRTKTSMAPIKWSHGSSREKFREGFLAEKEFIESSTEME